VSTLKRIAKEIISHIDMSDTLVKQRVEKEINMIAHTDGVYGENNLENFYRIWQKHKNEKGDENKTNSWLAYYLGLTTKEPDSDEITDRRVYARASFPDIDTDFDCFYQEFIFDYLAEKYGNDFVGRTGTYQGLKMRASLTRIIKALDLANAFHLGPKEFKTQNVQKVDEILKNIPHAKGTQALKVKDENGKLVNINTIADAYKYFKDFAYYMDKYPEIMQHSKNIEGLLSSFGRHPAGICLSNIPLYELCPFRPAKKNKAEDEEQGYVTQFVYEDLELLGLIKFDILAISTLSAIDRTLKAIKTNYGIDIDIENMDFKDEKTFQLFREGNLIGVFQCEGWGMQETMKSIHVDRFEDISVALALYRPGPMDSIPEYAARKLGGKAVDYFHPSIEPFVKPYLSTTYGILAFQEQVMQVFEALANIPKTDAYELIKGIGKKQIDLIVKFKQRFIDGCGKNNIPTGVATSYWENVITPFASYGFNACLLGDMRVKDINTNTFYTIEELSEMSTDKQQSMYLNSYVDNDIISDQLIEVFETGEKDVFEAELENGFKIRSTMDHKFLCEDKKMYTLEDIIDKNLEIICYEQKIMTGLKIKSIKYLGKQKTYNLTMKSNQHNYALYDNKVNKKFIISANSHAECYAVNAYICAYLKAHYPEEFMISLLNVENFRKKHEKIETLEKDLKRSDMKLLHKNINKCGVEYRLVRKRNINDGVTHSEISPTVMVKGVGYNAAVEIEKNQPYSSLRELAEKTSSKAVDQESVGSLFDAGFFDEYRKKYKQKFKQTITREMFAQKFSDMRKDLKKVSNSGKKSEDLFGKYK